ncbi:hypothetical protein QZH41_018279 [Actinostola sp. cb2023]|nr:hypothetical protein QZH41_018279 [Actinostola sp. cb2023]
MNKDIEQMYADLWEKDVQAKKQKEESDAKEQMERNRETLRVLQLQSEAIEKAKAGGSTVKRNGGWLAREKQEELAIDMKILEKLLEDTRNEAMEDTQRKERTQRRKPTLHEIL